MNNFRLNRHYGLFKHSTIPLTIFMILDAIGKNLSIHQNFYPFWIARML